MVGDDSASIRRRQYLSYASSVPFLAAGIVGLVTNQPYIAVLGTIGIYALVNATSLIDEIEPSGEGLEDRL